MKKWLSLFLVMALSLSVCALAQAEEEKIYEGVTIQWQRYPAGDLEAQTAWNQSIVDAFYEETGCTVEVDMVSWEDANTKVLSAITADEGPDVVQIIETAAGQIYSSGAFVALDEYIDKFGGYDAYLQAGLDYGTYDGVLYGLPWGGDTRLYYTRQSVLDAAGIESIPDDWTWSDFLDVLDKIKAAGYEAPFATMGSISTDVSFYYYYTLISNGGNIISEDNTTALFDSEEARQTLKQIADLVVDGYMPASFAELSEDTLTAAFINGDVQMVPLSSGQVAAAAAAGVDDIVALYPPRGEDGTYGGIMCISLMSVPAYSEASGCGHGFPRLPQQQGMAGLLQRLLQLDSRTPRRRPGRSVLRGMEPRAGERHGAGDLLHARQRAYRGHQLDDGGRACQLLRLSLGQRLHRRGNRRMPQPDADACARQSWTANRPNRIGRGGDPATACLRVRPFDDKDELL